MNLVLRFLEWILDIVCGAWLALHVFELLISTFGFANTGRIYGHITASLLRAMFQIDRLRLIGAIPSTSRPTALAAISWNSIVVATAAVLWLWSHFLPFLLFALTWAASVLLYFEQAFMPPIVLFLSSSTLTAHDFSRNLGAYLFPQKVASLLDLNPFDSMSSKERFARRRSVLLTSYRTRDPAAWIAVVEQLMRIVPTVIADLRTPSPAVKIEIERIFAEGLTDKTVFLVEAGVVDSQFASVVWERLKLSERWRFLSEDELNRVLKAERYGLLESRSLVDVLRAAKQETGFLI